MKNLKRKAVESTLLFARQAGVPREVFEAGRLVYGTAFIRRIQELEEKYIIEKDYKGGFITRWILTGRRNQEPKSADVPRELYIGTVCGVEWFEVVV